MVIGSLARKDIVFLGDREVYGEVLRVDSDHVLNSNVLDGQ